MEAKKIVIGNNITGQPYVPLPKQKELHQATEPFKGYVGGVGSGKSIWLVMDAFKYAIDWPGSVQVITAPNYRMMRDSTKITWDSWTPKVAYRWVAKDNKYVFYNGSEVWLRSSDDPETLRGPNINYFRMDEAAKDKKKTFDIMMGRIRLITKRADGKTAPNGGAIATTPKGFNWVYETFVRKGKKGMHKLVTSSSTENPYLPEEFVENLKSAYSGVFFDQEVSGLFTAAEGVVYKNFDMLKHIKPAEERRTAVKYWVGGIDWGFANPMVGLLAFVDHDGRFHFCSEIYQRKLTIADFGEKLRDQEREVCKRLGVEWPIDVTYFCDPSDTSIGAGSMQGMLREQGFNVQKADNSILPGINAVQKRLEVQEDGLPRLFVDPSCVEMITEFQQYCYDDYDPEKPFKDKPLKMNDHSMDAMRYAIMSEENGDRIISFEAEGLFE